MGKANELKSGRIRGLLQGTLGCLVLLVLGAVSLLLFETHETTPEYALFVFDRDLKIVVPCPALGMVWTMPVAGKPSLEESEWDGTVTWAEFRGSPNFEGYELPQGEGWDDFTLFGRPVTILRNLVFPPPSRWEEDGRWRY